MVQNDTHALTQIHSQKKSLVAEKGDKQCGQPAVVAFDATPGVYRGEQRHAKADASAIRYEYSPLYQQQPMASSSVDKDGDDHTATPVSKNVGLIHQDLSYFSLDASPRRDITAGMALGSHQFHAGCLLLTFVINANQIIHRDPKNLCKANSNVHRHAVSRTIPCFIGMQG